MIAILLVIALIAYGSLYPFSFRSDPHAGAGWILRSIPYTLTPRFAVDAIANILFYVPLGLTIFLYARRRTGRLTGALLAVGSSFVLSFTLEYLQFFQPGRISSGADVLANTIGGAAGVLFAGLWPGLAARLRVPSGPQLILWPLWLVSLLFPFIPALSLWMFRMKLRGAAAPGIAVMIGASLQWLIAGVVLAKERRPAVLAMLLLIPAQLFISERQPTLGLAIGALAGSAIALTRLSAPITAALAVVLLLLWELAPFRPAPARAFSWIPFADAMETLRSAAVAIVAAKCFAYGGTIVLLLRAGLRISVATLIVVGLLCVTELAQMRLAGRTPASTDPVIAAVIALALARFTLRSGV